MNFASNNYNTTWVKDWYSPEDSTRTQNIKLLGWQKKGVNQRNSISKFSSEDVIDLNSCRYHSFVELPDHTNTSSVSLTKDESDNETNII